MRAELEHFGGVWHVGYACLEDGFCFRRRGCGVVGLTSLAIRGGWFEVGDADWRYVCGEEKVVNVGVPWHGIAETVCGS